MSSANKKLFVTRPSLPPFEEVEPYLRSIWESLVLTNGGQFHRELESALRDYLGVANVSLFCNATIALMTALQALGIAGEVITTPYTFVATANSILWTGNRPVFVDIDPKTMNIDPERIEGAITPQTRAIMPVHCYGHPCDVQRIQQIADAHGLKVIYDAAHAFGVELENGSVLNRGDMSVVSFHATKVFTTFEGGAIVCGDEATKRRIDQLKNFGYVNEVTVTSAGINGKMSEFNAAVGLAQLGRVDGDMQKRKEIDAFYRASLADVRGIACVEAAGEKIANYSYFPILVDDGYPLSRDELYAKMRARGVYGRRYFYPLVSDFPMYRDLPSAARSNLPNAVQIADRIICLPIYPVLEREDLERVVSLIATA